MSEHHDIEVVQTFHERLGARDIPGLLALATEEIGVGGGRGHGEGKEFFLEWVRYASITVTPRRWFRKVNLEREGRHGMPGELMSTLVVEEDAVWHAARTGRETGRMRFATIYEVANGRLAGIARYGNIGEAVTTAGMYEENEIAVVES